MVQRKVPNKLGIQADHVKSEKLLGNLKPSSCQHQDGKNRGPLRKAISQPGKPPPLNAPTTAATPQKQLMIKTTDGSPNYMKSTSSSEARKERSQVSPLNVQTGSNGKKLMLNPGGTEAEGTSVKKVCPYNYCSLNGHHHKPVPPLKCFLKARRRSLKVQKSMKLEVLSPRRARPSGDGTEEIHGGLLDFSDDKPMIQEVGKDFFIEIYAKNTEDGDYETEKRTENEGKTADAFLGEPGGQIIETCFYAGHEAEAEQDNKNHISESSSDESQESEIDFEENSNDTSAAEMDVAVGFVIEDEKDGDTDCSSTFSEEEGIMGSCENRSDIEGECQAIMEEDDNISETIDMEWEEDQLSTSEVDAEADNLNKPDEDEFWTKVEFTITPEIKKHDWREDSETIMSDDAVSNCTEEILADEILQELLAEETASIDVQCCDGNPESDSVPHYWEILESIQVAGGLAFDQPSAAVYAFETVKTEEEKDKAERDLIDAVTTSAPTRKSIVEPIGTREKNQEDGVHVTDKSLGDDENDCTADISAGALDGHQEDKSLQAKNATIRPQISEKRGMVGTNKEDEIDELIEVAENNQEFSIAEFPDGEAGDATEDREQVANAELLFEIHVSDSPQRFSEADQDDAELNADGNHTTTEVCQLNATSEEDSSSQDLVDDSTPTEPHDRQLDEQDETNNVLENQNLFEEDQDEANKIKILPCMDFEALSNSRMHKINSTGDDKGEIEKMEVEVCNESCTAETFLSANNVTSTGSKHPFVFTRGNPNQELQYTCNNRKWTIGEKKPIKDLEEEREFNPREPNFLPVVPDPEAEKVDLRHQMMDDRKNSEEWMLDYALRQAVTKLAPARKRKVALLVEAFEKVLPTPKYETHIRHTSATFSHTRPIQACS